MIGGGSPDERRVGMGLQRRSWIQLDYLRGLSEKSAIVTAGREYV